MIGSTQGGKTHLTEQMLRELGEKHRGKKAVILVSKAGYETVYPGAPQGEVIKPGEIEQRDNE